MQKRLQYIFVIAFNFIAIVNYFSLGQSARLIEKNENYCIEFK